MANIIRRNQGQEPATTTASPFGWDPFRLMREMLRWDGGEGVFGDYRAFVPTYDVKETQDAFVFRADLPGVKEENLEVQLTGNRLAISGTREEEKREQGETYYATERSYGSFSRAFTLPDGTDPDQVTAELKNGVLQVLVPKKPEVQPKKISIGKSNEGKAKA